MGQFRVGTSGYKYDDWVGHFYPEGMSDKDFLGYYAQRFNTVEINSTFYSLFPPRTLFFMARKVPEGFDFVIKAHRSFTHERDAEASTFDQFEEMLRPLVEAGKLGGLLLQFPWSFKNNPTNQDHLMQVCERLADYPIIVEFRNADWLKEETYELLRDMSVGFCCVDEPRLKGLLPPVAVTTSEVGYVRFHGRNKEKWWKHDQAWERYDYLYDESELKEWLPKLERLCDETEKTYVFFNNHYQGKAAVNAQLLMKLIEGG